MMLTGYTEMDVAVEAINRGEIYRLITKPWNDDELRATIRQAFDHADLKAEIKRLNQVTREQNFKLQDMNRNLEAKVRERTKQLAAKHLELRNAYVQTIAALANAVDAKDAYTRGHSERVGVYASKIARQMGHAKEFIERVYIAGLLHDVGKIGIPDAVITKPDRLTPEEYEAIKQHPEIGARILEPVDFLRDVVPCVRPYRKALPLDVVYTELTKYSGSQYDPTCVDACLRVLDREGEGFIRQGQPFDIYQFIEG
jgi:HD-GYP domain-containing protein (c-di-GMP phosphodiesterase class II)